MSTVLCCRLILQLILLFVDIILWCWCWSLFRIITSEIGCIWPHIGKVCHWEDDPIHSYPWLLQFIQGIEKIQSVNVDGKWQLNTYIKSSFSGKLIVMDSLASLFEEITLYCETSYLYLPISAVCDSNEDHDKYKKNWSCQNQPNTCKTHIKISLFISIHLFTSVYLLAFFLRVKNRVLQNMKSNPF